MAPRQRITDQATQDRNIWLTFELAVRRKRAQDADTAFNTETESDLTQTWNTLTREHQTQLAAQYRQLQAAVTTNEAVLTRGEEAMAAEPQLRGSEATGWFYDPSLPDLDPLALRERLKTFGEARQAFKSMSREMISMLTALETLAPLYSALDSSLQWARAEQEDLEASLAALRQGISRHAEAVWDFERRRLGMDGTWIGGWNVGSGSFGKADLWVRRDEVGTIVDRLILKTSQARTLAPAEKAAGRGTWWEDHANTWSPDPRSPATHLLPNEIVALYTLRSRLGAENIVSIRNFKLVERERKMLLYMEYCCYGDMERWCGWYDENTYPSKTHPKKWTKEDWVRFHQGREGRESLATVGLLLDKGELAPSPINNFDTILHLDLKAANVFISTNTTGRYRGYPMAKVGDFGLCWTPGKTLRDLDDQKGAGTIYNKAPEQQLLGKQGTGRMDSKTNVWGMGNVMWSLIERESGDHRVIWARSSFAPNNDHDPDTHPEPRFRDFAKVKYSTRLLGLIRSCLHYSPNQRPNFEAILRVIREVCEQNQTLKNLVDLDEDDPAFQKGTPDSILQHMDSEDKNLKWARPGAPAQALPRPWNSRGRTILARIPPVIADQSNFDRDRVPGGRPGAGVKIPEAEKASERPQSATVALPTGPAVNAGPAGPADPPLGDQADQGTERPDVAVNPPTGNNGGAGSGQDEITGPETTRPSAHQSAGTMNGAKGPLVGPTTALRRPTSEDAGAEDRDDAVTNAPEAARRPCGCRCGDKAGCFHECCKRHLPDYATKGGPQMVQDARTVRGRANQGGKRGGKGGGKMAAKGTGAGVGKKRGRAEVDHDDGGEDAAQPAEAHMEAQDDGTDVVAAGVGLRKRKPAAEGADQTEKRPKAR